MRFLVSLTLSTAFCGCHLEDHGSRCGWPAGEASTYAHTGTAVAFIISELPGERAEALFIAMAALVSTAGEQFTNQIRAQAACRAVFSRKTRRLNGRAP
jgi:hypothetical protein